MLRFVAAAFAATTTAAVSSTAAPPSLADHSLEVRRGNVVQVSTQECSDCVTMEEFFASNRLVFLLFWERPTHGINNYKQAIVEGFHQTCKQLQFSQVACGKVDILNDRAYAEKFIDPKTAPAHIVVRDGVPQMMQKHHLDKLMQRPGDVEAMMWHLRDILSMEALEISTVVHGRKSLDSLLDKHSVAVVGFTGDSNDATKMTEAFRASAHSTVVSNRFSNMLAVSGSSKKAKDKARVAFIAAKGPGIAEALGQKPGTIVAFVDGKPVPLQDEATAQRLSVDVAAAVPELLQVSLGALEAAKAAGYAVPSPEEKKTVTTSSKSGKGSRAKMPKTGMEL